MVWDIRSSKINQTRLSASFSKKYLNSTFYNPRVIQTNTNLSLLDLFLLNKLVRTNHIELYQTLNSGYTKLNINKIDSPVVKNCLLYRFTNQKTNNNVLNKSTFKPSSNFRKCPKTQNLLIAKPLLRNNFTLRRKLFRPSSYYHRRRRS